MSETTRNSNGLIMNDRTASDKVITHNIISWLFVLVFIALGLLNLIFVHKVPGIFYIVASLIYLPSINTFLNKKLEFTIPLWTKILVGLAILWQLLPWMTLWKCLKPG